MAFMYGASLKNWGREKLTEVWKVWQLGLHLVPGKSEEQEADNTTDKNRLPFPNTRTE